MVLDILFLEKFLSSAGYLSITFVALFLLGCIALSFWGPISAKCNRILDLLILVIAALGVFGMVFETQTELNKREHSWKLHSLQSVCSTRMDNILDKEVWGYNNSDVYDWINNNEQLFRECLENQDTICTSVLKQLNDKQSNYYDQVSEYVVYYNQEMNYLNSIKNKWGASQDKQIVDMFIYPFFFLLGILLELLKWMDKSKVLEGVRYKIKSKNNL